MSGREQVNQVNQSYWAYVKRQFKKNKRAVVSTYVIIFMVILALSADFLANEKPLVAKYQGQTFFPVLKQYTVDLGLSQWPAELQGVKWAELEYDFVIFPPIPYSPNNLDFYNAPYKGPFHTQRVKSTRWRHWLGTDKLGRDVLSGLIHAVRVAFSVGVISMGLAAFIGILLGSLAGFFGDSKLKMTRISLILSIIALPFAIFYAFSVRSYVVSDAFEVSMLMIAWELLLSLLIFFAIMMIPILLAYPFKKISFLGKKIALPMDILISRLMEIIVSIPRLFLIIAVVAIAKPSLILVMIVIGATSWTGIARFIRAELLKVRNLEYIEAANALGYSNVRILFKHAIPNALSPVLIAVAFGIAAAILIEAFLSFIGLGVPAEVSTWGSMLNQARQVPTAWWMAIFPGFAIFITVTMFNLIGEGLTDALDPRLKQ